MSTSSSFKERKSEDLESALEQIQTTDLEYSSPHSFVSGAVDPKHGDLALLACCFVSGMVDSASFANWQVFVGMQSGNTVILGLSTASLPYDPYAWLDTIISLASFLLGCFVTYRITTHFVISPYSNRSILASLFLAQSLLILLSAGLSTSRSLIPQLPAPASVRSAANREIIRKIQTIILFPPLSFQAGIQITCSRLMGLDELPVNVLTSLYCDVMADARVFALNNVKRNRRVAAAVLLLSGSIAAAWMMRTAGGLQSVLWAAGGIKFVVAAALFVFMPSA